MAERKMRIGLYVNISPQWIAGAYYLENIIFALKSLPEHQRPSIKIISNTKDAFDFMDKTGYQPLTYRPLIRKRTYLEAFINKIYKPLFGKEFISTYPNDGEIDILFPSTRLPELNSISKKIYWIPDFQHHHYPEYFTEEELNERNDQFSFIANQSHSLLVLSSKSALNDFREFYPDATVSTTVLNFAVTHPEYSHIDIESLKTKFGIKGRYFIVPNQFWKHKNHMTALKAISMLKGKISDIDYVFTGSQNDYRNPGYFEEIKKFIDENGIKDDVIFTGFIDRAEQLLLMKNSICVVQPSLFEGWSTVVEDVKALKHRIIASDISVHREQLSNGCFFFNPTDFVKLADLMLEATNSEMPKYNGDYTKNIKLFGKEVLDVFQSFSSNRS